MGAEDTPEIGDTIISTRFDRSIAAAAPVTPAERLLVERLGAGHEDHLKMASRDTSLRTYTLTCECGATTQATDLELVVR